MSGYQFVAVNQDSKPCSFENIIEPNTLSYNYERNKTNVQEQEKVLNQVLITSATKFQENKHSVLNTNEAMIIPIQDMHYSIMNMHQLNNDQQHVVSLLSSSLSSPSPHHQETKKDREKLPCGSAIKPLNKNTKLFCSIQDQSRNFVDFRSLSKYQESLKNDNNTNEQLLKNDKKNNSIGKKTQLQSLFKAVDQNDFKGNESFQVDKNTETCPITSSVINLGKDLAAKEVLLDFYQLKLDLGIISNVDILRKMINCTRMEKQKDNILKNQIEETGVLKNSVEQQQKLNDDSIMEIVSSNFLSASEKLMEKEDLQNVLIITSLNVKAIQLSKNYLEHLSNDGLYMSGFIENTEKLNEFLRLFRLLTGSSFSIRRSKSKLNNDPTPEDRPLRKYKPGYLGKGQIKWEKNLGIPPIPFTGTPFTTEGSTTYQCIYGPKRIPKKTSENNEDRATNNEPSSKKRKRESKKKDCPAQIHIRTIHRFPSYNCALTVLRKDAAINRNNRGIILSRLRTDIINNKVIGEQGFWLRVPMPELHCNHTLDPYDGNELSDETVLEVKHLINETVMSA